MCGYKNRVVDEIIEKRLRNKGAILIEGPKWCGKTTTAEHHAKSILYMSDVDNIEKNLFPADTRPRNLLAGDDR